MRRASEVTVLLTAREFACACACDFLLGRVYLQFLAIMMGNEDLE